MTTKAGHGLVPPATPPRDPGGPADFSQLLAVLVATRPEEVVLVGRSGRLTAMQLEETSNQFANVLAELGIEPGSRVAVSLPNDIAAVVTFIGALKAGAIWVGVNHALAAPEKAFVLEDSGSPRWMSGRGTP